MRHVIELYRKAYQDHGKGRSALLWPKGRQEERFSALTSAIKRENYSILDYGCGFGDLKKYLNKRAVKFEYTGVDVVPEFINENIKEFGSSAKFSLINTYEDVKECYDFIVISGVFNTLFFDDKVAHWRLVQKIIRHLFSKTRVMLSVDFMTDNVDFIQLGSYHQSPERFYEFCIKNLTRRLSLDFSYLPYEFCAHLYKEQSILKPDNTYKGL
jgi:SAM-dependent methyltransferase